MTPVRFTTSPRAKRAQSGFMLLFIFLMAGIAAIMLYMELPKAAFESQRNREQLLVERGLEYRRAIQLYVRKEKKYPPTMEALEKTNERRYLRRRYLDPMTGKDEWRVINVGPNGEFTNSLVYKPKNPLEGDKKYNNTFISEAPPLGETNNTGGPGAVTLANRQRQSDIQGAPGTLPPPGGTPGGNLGADPNQPAMYGQQQTQQAIYGQQQQQPNPYQQQPQNLYQQQQQQNPYQQPNPYQQQPNPYQQQPNPYQQQPNPYQQQPGQQPPISSYPQSPGFPQQGNPPIGFPATPGQQGFGSQGVANSQTGGVVPQQLGYNPYAQPQAPNPYNQQQYPYGTNQNPITSTNPAVAGQIMDMITRPRQPQTGIGNQPNTGFGSGVSSNPGFAGSGSLASPNSSSMNAGLGAGGLGAGIAGVASKFEAEGIMLYNERSKYNEWEFLYDYKRDSKMTGSALQQGAQGMSNPGNTVGTGSSFGNNPNSGFGNNPNSGFGNNPNSGFGNSGFGNNPSMPIRR